MKSVDKFLLGLLRLLPKNLLSRITGALARIPLPVPLNILLVRAYSALYGVDLTEAELRPSQYHSLNSFFVRKLKPSARPMDPDPKSILSPVDGVVSQCSRISKGTLLQAKGWTYPLRDLLSDPQKATQFLEGSSCTLYLSPSDYHRIHLPLDGAVQSIQYIPGQLFPVNSFSLSRIRNLFVINERLIIYLRTDLGALAMVLVGATNVGKIRLLFDDIRKQVFQRGPFQRKYRPEIPLRKGEEMGCFELGSTVILLFEKDAVKLSIQAGNSVRVGKPIGFRS